MKIRLHIVSIVAIIVVLALPALVLAGTWDIDPAHSEVGFKVRHMMVTNVRGNFSDFKGTLELDETDITRSTVDVTIQAASIYTGVEKRDEHLRSPDFFDAAKFPALTFKSKRFTKISDSSFQIIGDLSIHGVSREVVLEAEGLDQQARDPYGNTITGASATTKLNRKDYGLNWNKALETGGFLVGDEITILLEVEFKKRAE